MASLIRLTERAWAIPVLAALACGVAPRIPVLAAHLGASRAAVGEAVDHLVGLGLIARNPGHGHPLRPELLACDADALAWAGRVQAAVAAEGVAALARKKWTLPLLAALPAPTGFAALRRGLDPVSPRALSLALKEAVEAGLIARALVDAAPPAALYRRTPAGARLAAAMAHGGGPFVGRAPQRRRGPA